MEDERRRLQGEREQGVYDAPFRKTDPTVATEHRVAHALDYIAAQLGMINRKLDAITQERPDSPPPQKKP